MDWSKLIRRRDWFGRSLRGGGTAGAGMPEGAGRVLEVAAGSAGLGVRGEREAVGEDQRADGRAVGVGGVSGVGVSGVGVGGVGVGGGARGGGADEVLGGGEVAGGCGCLAGRAGRGVRAGGGRG